MKTKIRVTLLILLIASSVLGRCPHQSLFNPCTCEKKNFKSIVRCTDVSKFDDLQKVFDGTLDFHFDSFYLSNSRVPYLNSTWFATKRIGKVGLFDTTLVGLLDRNANETFSSVKQIKILNSALLRRLKWSHFKPFVRLRSLSMSGVEVKTLGKGFQENVSPQLRYLTINNTATAILEDEVFSGKGRLKQIVIRKGGIKILKNSYFKDQKRSLEIMDFSHNPINDLPVDLFEGFQRLKLVTFQGTRIKTLWKPTLDKAIEFGIMDFKGSPLDCSCLLLWPYVIPKLSYMLLGECHSPRKLKSKRLSDLTEEDFDFCFEEVPEKTVITS